MICCPWWHGDYSDVMISAMASQITCVSSVCSGADQRKHQSSTSLAFAKGIHRILVDSPHKGQLTRKMFPFDGVIMSNPGAGSYDKFGTMITLKFQCYISPYRGWAPACVSFHFHIDIWSDGRFCEISSGILVMPCDDRIRNLHYSDVTWVPWRLKSPTARLFSHLIV